MKICIIASEMLAQRLGGAAGPAVMLAGELVKSGINVCVMSTEDNQAPPSWHYRKVDTRHRKIYKLAQAVKESEADIVHIFGGSRATMLGAFITRTTGKPVVQTIINVDPRYYVYPAYGIRKLVSDHIRFAGIKSIAHAVCHSRYAAESLAGIGYPESKISVITPGVFFKETPTFNGHANPGSDSILFWTGANKYERGFDTFLNAIPPVLKQCPQAQFNAAVLNFIEKDLKDAAGRISTKTGKLHVFEDPSGEYGINGNKAKISVYSLVQASSIIVLPFKINPQEPAFSLIQSMALGKPVITTDIGSNSELITSNKNGILIKPDTPAALAEAIIHLLKNNSEKERIAQAARTFISERYRWDTYARPIIQIYERLLS
jgi:glycosyltransferase involved in cell wall biosynthesis